MSAILIAMSSLLTLGLLAVPATDLEVKISKSQLPPAVASALDQRYPGAQMLGFTRETDREGVHYEAEMRVRGRRVDALFGPRGKWLGDETEIRFADLPAPVKRAFAWYSSRGYRAGKVERIASEGRKSLQFEILAKNSDGMRELLFEAGGRLTKSETVHDAD